MPDQTCQLAAIVLARRSLSGGGFTNIVGYTQLMGENEQKAMQVLRKNRKIHQSIIKKHHGKWLKEMCDGTLASVKSSVVFRLSRSNFCS